MRNPCNGQARIVPKDKGSFPWTISYTGSAKGRRVCTADEQERYKQDIDMIKLKPSSNHPTISSIIVIGLYH
jgi:hypothetical protein